MQSSRARLYNQNLHWLLYDEAGNFTKLIQLFEGANLSLNADVTYVSREDEERFILHDVYNKGSHLGGKLNITVDQTLQCNRSHCQVKEYLSELHLRPRLQHRMDLSSVTFRLAALVRFLNVNWKSLYWTLPLRFLYCQLIPARRNSSSSLTVTAIRTWIRFLALAIDLSCTLRKF